MQACALATSCFPWAVVVETRSRRLHSFDQHHAPSARPPARQWLASWVGERSFAAAILDQRSNCKSVSGCRRLRPPVLMYPPQSAMFIERRFYMPPCVLVKCVRRCVRLWPCHQRRGQLYTDGATRST